MDASSFTTSLNLAELSILNEAQSILAPSAQEIRARLIELDVLGKGGVLKTQPVKPKDKSVFGTLVVSLPTIFQGGDLMVKSDSGAARRFEWCHNPDQLLQWAAYNSTCKYEALPVTAGYRVMLTYVLVNPNGAANSSPSPRGGIRSSYSLEEKLHEAFKNPEFAPNGAKLGFALTHNGVVEEGNAIPVLQGSDRMLKTCLDPLGLKYEFIPVYQSYNYDASRLIKQQDDDVHSEANDSRKRNRDDYEYDELSEWRFDEEDAKAQGIWGGDGALHLFDQNRSSFFAKMAKLLQELRELGRCIENSVFVCDGELPLSPGSKQDSTSVAHIKLHYESSDASISEIRFPGCSDEELKQLVAASKPASFGRGQEEVLDPTYRDAVRMDASQFTTSLNVAELPILNEIQSFLAPDTQDIRARLYKLNVYGPGGFFKAHRDTPRGTQMFGSLVVCLPTAFEGGEFVVKNDDGVEQRFAWCDNPEQVVQWCAFYSDCEHEVLPVTKGYRVTLTYLLENPALQSGTSVANQVPRTTAEESGNATLAEKLSEALRDTDFAPKGVKLGFALSHGYVVDKEGTIPMLKGPDRMLKEDLDRLGLKYAFVPVYRSDSYDATF
ncbi:hypothetical protein Poli38472_011583 [Pythium oligandrum]|uniref:Fe2OG dioxygenase domain-containing protein n=1 Tax=Pythium oligandrum TaxID=41045 RepID=A0A8K1CLU4_PYTOL|nr:hypothetical protein Poli38472_011583 [Pythium oligandrum]|eukprot:TMW64703.1 hypothetical protein Poli38472_011583 [Pythium oligandrum]